MKALTIAASAAALACAIPAIAAAQAAPVPGVYANIGYANTNDTGANVGTIQGRLGYRFNSWLGVEGELAGGVKSDTVSTSVGAATVTGKAKISHQEAIYGVGFLPVGTNWDLLARVGYGHTKINLSEPRIEVIKFRDLASRIGNESRTVAALHMYVRGEAPGQMIVIFDREQALDFVSAFLKRVIGDIQIFDSIADSTLKELGNIIAGSYLTAIIQLTNINLLPSVPTLSYGTIQAAFRTLMSILPDQDVFLIESAFLDKEKVVAGQFILIPETGSLGPLLSVFGVE